MCVNGVEPGLDVVEVWVEVVFDVGEKGWLLCWCCATFRIGLRAIEAFLV